MFLSSPADPMTDPEYVMTPYGARYRAPEGPWARVREVARLGLRRFGTVTAPLRCTPDYLIIGTKRGGTTSLARYLLEHPDVLSLFPARENRKGTYYFDVNYGRGDAWYRSHFPTRMARQLRERRAGHNLLIGEATPYYLYHPHAPRRARAMVPDAKVIIMLRHPVERAYSHWIERTRNGVETLSFPDAIEAEAQRMAGEEAHMLSDPSYTSFAHQHYSYVDQSRYAPSLARWMEAYPASQLLIVRSEDFYADPAAVYHQTLEFLGLNPFMPEQFKAWNNKPKDPMDQALRDRLWPEFSDDIAEVERLLQRSMGWT